MSEWADADHPWPASDLPRAVQALSLADLLAEMQVGSYWFVGRGSPTEYVFTVRAVVDGGQVVSRRLSDNGRRWKYEVHDIALYCRLHSEGRLERQATVVRYYGGEAVKS